MREERVRASMLPRHARAPAEWRWASLMTELGLSRRPAETRTPRPAEARGARPPVGHDPLADPVAITERCVIGDQIRVPAAWCDVAGCTAGFADPAAMGEADNRARALAAGWHSDAWGRLVCPACRQDAGVTWERRAPGPSRSAPVMARGRSPVGLGRHRGA
jgi:hypothetical protein